MLFTLLALPLLANAHAAPGSGFELVCHATKGGGSEDACVTTRDGVTRVIVPDADTVVEIDPDGLVVDSTHGDIVIDFPTSGLTLDGSSRRFKAGVVGDVVGGRLTGVTVDTNDVVVDTSPVAIVIDCPGAGIIIDIVAAGLTVTDTKTDTVLYTGAGPGWQSVPAPERLVVTGETSGVVTEEIVFLEASFSGVHSGVRLRDAEIGVLENSGTLNGISATRTSIGEVVNTGTIHGNL